MKNFAIKVIYVFLLGLAFVSVYSSEAIEIGDEELSITVDFTYASKYMWHGFDIFENEGAFHPSVEFGYKEFYAGLWGAWPNTSGFEELTEIDWYAGYARSFYEEEPYAFSIDMFYTYFSFPKINSQIDGQEVAFTVSLDNLLPIGPSTLAPSYTVYYEWTGMQGNGAIDDGFYHTFALSYDVPVPALIPDQEEQAITLMADATYGDGAYDTTSDWQYATIGASTTFEWKGIYLTPAVYYQFSFDDSVNNEDDLYTTISIGYTF
ncbi:hypothetical protein K8I31_03275 [bacterium]|nr:hypothetical protein [bacterium]